jgi:hypothetical protein
MTGLVTLLLRTLQPLPHLTRSQVSPQVLGTTRDIEQFVIRRRVLLT